MGLEKKAFDGTAWHYARYRWGYPEELVGLLVRVFGLDGTGRLLDLGTGTGQVVFALGGHFVEVIGIDSSEDMLVEARHQCGSQGHSNVKWLRLSAEEINSDLGSFRLITAGRSFHWMEREDVIRRSYDLLEPGGGFAVLGVGGIDDDDTSSWQREMRRVVDRWLHTRERSIQWRTRLQVRHEDLIRASRFRTIGHGHYVFRRVRDIDSVVGFLYSTAYANRVVLGSRAEAFEAELRASLLNVEPDGHFVEDVNVYFVLARKDSAI